jgi:hypothetical protein
LAFLGAILTFHKDFHWRSTAGRFYARRALSGPEQLDIFIPLHRGERLRQWAGLAVEHNVELEHPGGESAFAHWLRDHGHAPPGLCDEAVTVLVAVMRECERETLHPEA